MNLSRNSHPSDNRLDRHDLALVVFLFLATLGLYHQVPQFAYLRFDDPVYVSQNWHVQSGLNAQSIRYAMTAIISSNWHPLTVLVEMAVVQIFGSSSSALFHTVCASLHAANVALLFLFLRIATRLRFSSAVAAMLWGWHPLRVESVAWVGEMKDVLCGFFWLLAMLVFVRYRRQPRITTYLPVLACAVLAMLSKPMAVTLPAALMLLNFWPLQQQKITRRWIARRLLEQLPLVLLSIVVSIVSVRTQTETHATGSLTVFPFSLRITNALFSYLRYLGKQALPIHLGLIYPHPGMLGRTVPVFQWASGAAAFLLASALVWRMRRSKPYLIVGWFWFVGCLVPVIGLVQVGQAAMADRYSYLPGIGLTVALVWFVTDAISGRSGLKVAFGILAAAWVVAFGAVSLKQISYWANDVTLMAHSNEVIPDDFLAQSSLSLDTAASGNIPRAIALARSAISLVPNNLEAHHSLAMALAADNQLPAAVTEEEKAIRLEPGDDWLWMDLGRLLVRQHRLPEAAREFRHVLDLDPDQPEARHDLAGVLAMEGDYDGAIAQWQIVVQQIPRFGPAQGLLADALRLRGDRSGAVEHYRAALADGQTNPDWEANLAWQVAIDPAATPDQLQSLLATAKDACDQTRDQLPFPLYAYSLTLARLGRFDDAVQAATAAMRRADSTNQPQMAKAIRSRIDAYRQGLIVNPH